MIKLVMFDLDGTLLPFDQKEFVKAYFGGLAKKLAPHGYDPEKVINGIWAGAAAMAKNDGSRKNEEVWWESFVNIFGERALADIPIFEEYYEKDFDSVKSVCGYEPMAKEIIDMLHARGVRTVLATNPMFPSIATEKRMSWAGLTPKDFEIFTTYENYSSCKPNLAYYKEILAKTDCLPEECVMVGNDVREDMVAGKLGMKVFLLTDHLLNPDEEDISAYPNGGFPELRAFLEDVIS